MLGYTILTMPNVANSLLEAGEIVQEKYFRAVNIISSSAEIGRLYIPEDNEDVLAIPCRTYPLPKTTKTIYYHVNHEQAVVDILGLIDQRRNPAYRFREVRQDGMDVFG